MKNLTLILQLLLLVIIGNVFGTEETNSLNKTRPKIIIIGAGTAGIAAAVELQKSDLFDVEVFEGSDRIGGRIHRGKLGNSYVELGAEWVHGEEGNKVWELMKDSGLLVNEDRYNSMLYITSKGDVLDNATEEWLEEIQDKILGVSESVQNVPGRKLEIVSLAEIAERKLEEYLLKNKIVVSSWLKRAIMNWLHSSANSWEGSDDWSLSSGQSSAYQTAKGNQEISWKYPSMYLSFLKFLLTGDGSGDPGDIQIPNWIRLNTIVKRIHYSTESNRDQKPYNVEVQVEEGGQQKLYQADHVVTTTSLGYLKENWKTMFQPTLSSNKANAIEKLGFGSVNKIFLEFSVPWWPKDLDGFNLLWDDDFEMDPDYKPFWKINGTNTMLSTLFDNMPIWVRSISSFIIASQNPNALECFITGSASRYMEQLTLKKRDQEIINGIMKPLRQFFGTSRKNISVVENPIRVLTSKWASNELIRGSYSYVTVDSEKANVSANDLEEPILDNTGKPIICFAGEATSIHQFSTVHGAYESGIREAKRILNVYKATEKSSANGIISSRQLLLCSWIPFLTILFKSSIMSLSHIF